MHNSTRCRPATETATAPDGFTYFFNQNLQEIGGIAGPFADDQPALGVAYSPVADVGYIAWANAAGLTMKSRLFDTNTLECDRRHRRQPRSSTPPMNYDFP